jgi:hypothetical protein
MTVAWTAPAWIRGLREAGATVLEYDWTKNYSDGLMGYVERRFVLGPGIGRINRALIEKAHRASPDVVLIYAGHPIRPDTVRDLAESYWVAGYHNDDPFGVLARKAYFRYFRESLPYYTSHHVFREVNITDYKRKSCSRVRLLRSYYLPWMHYPVSVTEEELERLGATVVFIGNAEPGARVNYISFLVEAGINVRIYSNPKYWHRYLPRSILRRLPPITVASGLDYARVIRSSKICLALFSERNRDQYSLRSFEIPACGGFMLAQRTPVMVSLFEEGKEAEYFGDKEELITKIDQYLKDDEARQRIAAACRERCLRDGHDIVSRMRQWLTDLREWGLVERSA